MLKTLLKFFSYLVIILFGTIFVIWLLLSLPAWGNFKWIPAGILFIILGVGLYISNYYQHGVDKQPKWEQITRLIGAIILFALVVVLAYWKIGR